PQDNVKHGSLAKEKAFYFNRAPRPNNGQNGKPILVKANHFQLKIKPKLIYHYSLKIIPEKCSKRLNREIVEYFVNQHEGILFDISKTVFDGKKNLYTLEEINFGKNNQQKYVFNIPQNLNFVNSQQYSLTIEFIGQIDMMNIYESLKGFP
ncbi:MAG: argonaute 1, partial [Paramarteilia canceri]